MVALVQKINDATELNPYVNLKITVQRSQTVVFQ